MALIYITGAPGAGKTTLERELHDRGFETHDLDDPDMGGAHNKLTGKREPIPPADQRTKEWFEQHEWRIFKPAVEELKKRAEYKTIFVCGVAAKDTEIIPLFDKVIYLDVDEDTLRQRITDRTDNDYGKNDFELKEILERRRAIEATYQNLGVLSIDGSQQPEAIVDAILAEVE